MQQENQTALTEIFAGYKGGDKMPLAGYATLLGIYNTALLTLLLTEKNSAPQTPADIKPADLLLLGITTFKLSRVISRDRVTSPLRAPFTEYIKPDGGSEIKEKVRGTGLQRAVGDLLICPFCLAPWVAAALGVGLLVKPKSTRFLTKLFTVVAFADILQETYEFLKHKEK